MTDILRHPRDHYDDSIEEDYPPRDINPKDIR